MSTRTGIFFQTDKNGRRVAYRWAASQIRAFRISVAEAEMLIATGQADELPGHPLR